MQRNNEVYLDGFEEKRKHYMSAPYGSGKDSIRLVWDLDSSSGTIQSRYQE